jgi:hypothetical protein
MTYSLVRPSSNPNGFLAILTQPDVWEPQALDGVAKPKLFPFGDEEWVFAMSDETGPVAILIFVSLGQGVYEQHSAIPEKHRGSWNQMIEEAHRALFLQTDATMIVTFCPDWMPLLTKVSARFGAKKMWHKDFIGNRSSVPYGADMMGLTVMDWAWRNHLNFKQQGHEWHESAFADGAQHHDDDIAHDGFVGLALQMSVEQPQKAQMVYNTWARTAGYYPLTILWASDGNSLIDIGSSTILNRGGKFAAALPVLCPQQPPSSP